MLIWSYVVSKQSIIGGKSILSLWSSSCLWLFGLRSIFVKLHKLGKIKLGFLKDLYFSNHATIILKWEDLCAALFLNLFANISFYQDFDKIFEVGFLNWGLHDLHHFLSDQLFLWCFGVASGFHLSWSLLGEANGKHSNDISIHGLSLNKGLNEWVPFLDHMARMISCDVHTMEVSVAIESLDLINLELKLSPGLLFFWIWCIAIIKRNLNDTSSKAVTCLN